MSKNMINWVEIPVKDLNRAKCFYNIVLSTDFTDMEIPGGQMAMFPWNEGGENASGALVKAQGYEPSETGTLPYFYSEDVNIELKRVEQAGGKVIQPKVPIGEYGFIGIAIDSEGNRIGFNSMK